MAQDRIQEARSLIEQKRYSEARALLQTIDHPKALEWIQKIDDLTGGQYATPAGSNNAQTMIGVRPSAPSYEQQTMISSRPSAPEPTTHPLTSAPQPQAQVYTPVYGTNTGAAGAVSVSAEPQHKSGSVATLPLAVLGAVLGAIVGALIWAAIVYFANYEHTLMAMLVGLLAGGGAVLFTGNRRGILVQLPAMLASIGGIVLGKYLAVYAVLLKDVAESSNNSQAVINRFMAQYPLFGSDSISEFVDYMKTFELSMDEPQNLMFNVLFMGLAVFIAFSIASHNGMGRRR